MERRNQAVRGSVRAQKGYAPPPPPPPPFFFPDQTQSKGRCGAGLESRTGGTPAKARISGRENQPCSDRMRPGALSRLKVLLVCTSDSRNIGEMGWVRGNARTS